MWELNLILEIPSREITSDVPGLRPAYRSKKGDYTKFFHLRGVQFSFWLEKRRFGAIAITNRAIPWNFH